MIPVTDQFPGVTVIVRSAALARYCGFEMSLEALHVPIQTQISRAISVNIAGTPNTIIKDGVQPFVWFIDDDHQFDYYHLLRLMAHDLPIVNGMTCMNKPPFSPVIYSGEIEWGEEKFPDLDAATNAIAGGGEKGKQALIEVLRRREYVAMKKKYPTFSWASLDKESGLKKVFACGLSGMLIKREVFEKLPYPWFELGQTNSEECAEDLWFCEKARKAGYEIVVDLGLAFGHFAPCAAWPCRLEDGSWTIRLTWENGQSIVITRPDRVPERVIQVDESKVAELGTKGSKIVQRTKELVAGGLSESDAFTQAMNEAEADIKPEPERNNVIDISEHRK